MICFTICKSYKTWYIFAIRMFQFCLQVTCQQILPVNTVTGLLFCNDCVNSSKSAVDEEQWGVLLYLYREKYEPCPWTLQLSQKHYRLGKGWKCPRILPGHFSLWRWGHYIVSEHRNLSIHWHSIISQKTGILLYVFLPSWMAVPCPVMSQCY